jgi:hypothetical protein
MYQQQRKDVRQGLRKTVNWVTIAKESTPGFHRLRTEAGRKRVLEKLRNAVYTRRKRRNNQLPDMPT